MMQWKCPACFVCDLLVYKSSRQITVVSFDDNGVGPPFAFAPSSLLLGTLSRDGSMCDRSRNRRKNGVLVAEQDQSSRLWT
eukprot:scaffold42145_cov221-Amphora_coffeaeformis.AAC.2